jgi:hypothetical protein
MSKYLGKVMYLKKPKHIITWNGASTFKYCVEKRISSVLNMHLNKTCGSLKVGTDIVMLSEKEMRYA